MKKVKKPGKLGIAVMAVIVAADVAANAALVQYSGFLDNYFAAKRVDADAAESTRADAEKIVQKVVGEGSVLLKNNNNVLPFSEGEGVNVFGWQSIAPTYGGTGSGSSSAEGAIDFYQALSNAGIEYNSSLYDFYTGLGLAKPEQSGWSGSDFSMTEADPDAYTGDLMQSAKDYSDTAIIYLARIGGEGGDLPTDMYEAGYSQIDDGKHYLELTNDEIALFDMVCNEYQFENIIVILNSSNAMELGFLDTYDIDSCLWVGGPGATGMEAVGQILAGTINPSGKLPNTYIYDLTQEPTYYNMGDFTYTNATYFGTSFSGGKGDEANYKFIDYEEGIYVGYRYFETRFIDNETGLCDEAAYQAMVQFPFGYGLSYTTFSQEISNYTTDEEGNITIEVTVTNTGDTAGKEVAEIYYTAPYTVGGIEKSHVVLAGFDKTDELEPGASEVLTIRFNEEDMASYDENAIKSANGAYVLEAGDYEIKLMSDAHNVIDSVTYTVDRDIIYDDEHDGKRSTDLVTATNLFTGTTTDGTGETIMMSRADWEGTVPTEYPADREAPQALIDLLNAPLSEEDVTVVTGADYGLTMEDVADLEKSDEKWQQLVEQLSVSELTNLTGFGGHQTVALKSIGKAATTDENGPTGISAMQANDENGASYCSEPVMAATWNTDLIYEMGVALGAEMLAHGLDGIYGPAMNIHRSAFSGRNFEYYSEDGYLSYVMGAAEVSGIQANEGTYVYMKHFAVNDQETNRIGGIMWCGEQAMREIYLRGFEGAVKDGGAKAAMGSINLLNGTWTGADRNLLTGVLRDEWGFEGFVVTDYVSGEYMDADYGVRAGTSTMDTYTGAPCNEITDTTIYYMQEAARDILYVTADTVAQQNYDAQFLTPAITIAIIVNGVLIALLALTIVLRVRKMKAYKESLSGESKES